MNTHSIRSEYTLEGINHRLEVVEEWISDLKGRVMESTQAKQQIFFNENIIRDSFIYYLQQTHLRFEDVYKLKVKG